MGSVPPTIVTGKLKHASTFLHFIMSQTISSRESAIAGILRTPFIKPDACLAEVPDEELIRIVAGELLFSSAIHPSSIDTVIVASSAPVGRAVMDEVASSCRSLGFDTHFRLLSISSGFGSDLAALMDAAMRVSSGDTEAALIIGLGTGEGFPRKSLDLRSYPSMKVTDRYPSTFEERIAYAEASIRKASARARRGTMAGVCKIGFPPYFESIFEKDGIERGINPTDFCLQENFDNSGKQMLVCDFIAPSRIGLGALLLTTTERAHSAGSGRILRITGLKHIGIPKHLLGAGAAIALGSLLSEEAVSLEDIGVLEVMETTSAQAISTLKHLEIDSKRFIIADRDETDGRPTVNPSGGSLAFGFVSSCSGIMMLINATDYMAQNQIQLGAVAYEDVRGEAMTVLLESV